MWMPGNDAVGHYRHLFQYDRLYDAWKKVGQPPDSLMITTRDYQYNFRAVRDGVNPTFLLSHGYLFLETTVHHFALTQPDGCVRINSGSFSSVLRE